MFSRHSVKKNRQVWNMEHFSSCSVLMMSIRRARTQNTIRKNTDALLETSREVVLEENTEETEHMENGERFR